LHQEKVRKLTWAVLGRSHGYEAKPFLRKFCNILVKAAIFKVLNLDEFNTHRSKSLGPTRSKLLRSGNESKATEIFGIF